MTFSWCGKGICAAMCLWMVCFFLSQKLWFSAVSEEIILVPLIPEPLTIHDIAFGILTSNANVYTRITMSERTWLSDIPYSSVVFFAEIGGRTKETGSPIVDVSMNPLTFLSQGQRREVWDHGSAAFKLIAAVDWMATHAKEKKWFFFGDDDTLVFPRCLVKHLDVYISEDPVWLGQMCGKTPGAETLCGGAGFIINYPALVLLASRLKPLMSQVGVDHYGDVTISRYLHALKVPFTSVLWLRSQPPLFYFTRMGRDEYPGMRGVKDVCTFHYVTKERLKEMETTYDNNDLIEMVYREHLSQ